MLRELTERSNGGITVRLLWDDSAASDGHSAEFQVHVFEGDEPANFVFMLDSFEEAREAYFHPYASRNLALKKGKITA